MNYDHSITNIRLHREYNNRKYIFSNFDLCYDSIQIYMCANVVYGTLDPLRIVSMVFMCVVDHFTNETKPLPAKSNIIRVICNETYHALGLSVGLGLGLGLGLDLGLSSGLTLAERNVTGVIRKCQGMHTLLATCILQVLQVSDTTVSQCGER